jgi:hypothetical protein
LPPNLDLSEWIVGVARLSFEIRTLLDGKASPSMSEGGQTQQQQVPTGAPADERDNSSRPSLAAQKLQPDYQMS